MQALQLWLQSQVDRGLSALLDTSALDDWYEDMPPRLEEVKAPAVALWIRNAQARVRRAEPHWQERVMLDLALIQHLCDRVLLTGAPSQWSASERDLLRTVLGHELTESEVLARGTAVEDRWLIMGIRERFVSPRLPIVEQRTWLWGQNTEQTVYVLHTFRKDRPHPIKASTGQMIKATLVPIPGEATHQALITDHHVEDGEVQWPLMTTEASWQRLAAHLQTNPWSSLEPLILRDVNITSYPPGDDGDRAPPQIRTMHGTLPLRLNSAPLADLIAAQSAASAGRPMHLVGEWNGHELTPLSAWRNNALCWRNVSEV